MTELLLSGQHLTPSPRRVGRTPRMRTGQSVIELPPPALSYEIIVKDKFGNIVDYRVGEAKSYVRQWVDWMRRNMMDAVANIKDITGVNRTPATFLPYIAAPAGTDYGIVVGSGSTAVTLSDYVLATVLPHGVDISYQAMSIAALGSSSSSAQITSTRTFINISVGAVTIREIGLYCLYQTFYYCLARDVLVSPVELPVGGSVIITYRQSVASSSYLKGRMSLLRGREANVSEVIKDIAGVDQSLEASTTQYEWQPTVLFGTGTTAVSMSDFVIEAEIVEGAGAGQLNYSAHVISAVTVTATAAYFTIDKSATNNSGGTITVTEVALYARFRNAAFATKYVCTSRKILGTPVTILAGDTYTHTYTIKIGT